MNDHKMDKRKVEQERLARNKDLQIEILLEKLMIPKNVNQLPTDFKAVAPKIMDAGYHLP